MSSEPLDIGRPRVRFRRGRQGFGKAVEECRAGPPERRNGQGRPGDGAEGGDIPVVDDLPALVPVTSAELAVIETYLGVLIDELTQLSGSDVPPTPFKTRATAPSGQTRT